MVTEGLSLRFKRNKQKKKPISFLNLSPHPDGGNKKIYKQKFAMNEGKKEESEDVVVDSVPHLDSSLLYDESPQTFLTGQCHVHPAETTNKASSSIY